MTILRISRRGFLWLALPALALGQTGLERRQVQELERLITAEMARQGIPGMSVAVAVRGRVLWAAGFGLADLENHVPAKATTVYRLASISKPFTAVAVLQLVEQGKMDLEAPVEKYVPSFPKKQWPVTIRHLLCHQGGIRHYRDGAEMNSTRHYTDLIEPLQIFQNDPLLFEPGTRFSYTTYGYNLLGAAVEGASGMKFLDYLRRHIFEPAGLRRMRDDNVYDLIPERARGYRRVLGGKIENCALADTSNKIPGGGLVGTVEDLVDFAIHLNGGTLLKKDTVGRMCTPQKTRDGKSTPYGLGWQVFERGAQRWVGHGGAQQGVRTLLLMRPERGFAVALMANLEGVNLETAAVGIAAIVLGEPRSAPD